MQVEIGIGKAGRQAYGFDDITIVPTRRTRDRGDVDISWELDAYRCELPMMSAAMDGVTSPATAIRIGELGGLGCLNLEGLWTRYADPAAILDEIANLDDADVTRRLQEIYAAPIQEELIVKRIREIKDADVHACASLSPQRVERYAPFVLEAELDVLVIQGTVVSAEHVSKTGEPLNLKKFIRGFDLPVIVGGCASYSGALHLMRTGAAGILVGVGPGHASTTRSVLGIGVAQATAIADAAGARIRHLDETGVYVHVIADGGMRTGGDVAKAIVCGADAVMLGAPLAAAHTAPGQGYHWGTLSGHLELPRGVRVHTGRHGTLEEILVGPAQDNDGTRNLFGGLRASMAMTGHDTIKAFQKAEVMVTAAPEPPSPQYTLASMGF